MPMNVESFNLDHRTVAAPYVRVADTKHLPGGDDDLLMVQEAADYLGVHLRAMYRYIEAGRAEGVVRATEIEVRVRRIDLHDVVA